LNSYNFRLLNAETDSIFINKPDNSPFSDEEKNKLLKELNDLFPDLINWESDGEYERCIIFKGKNYVLYNKDKTIYKGSALKSSKLEPALKEMQKKMIEALILDKQAELLDIYEFYIKEINEITDIKRWCQKKTWTAKIGNCRGHDTMSKEEKKIAGIRKNESDIFDAAANKIMQEGDKLYVYPTIIKENCETKVYKNGKIKEKRTIVTGLKLAENWANDHDKNKLYNRIFDNIKLFSTVIDTSIFKNYSDID